MRIAGRCSIMISTPDRAGRMQITLQRIRVRRRDHRVLPALPVIHARAVVAEVQIDPLPALSAMAYHPRMQSALCPLLPGGLSQQNADGDHADCAG